MRATQHSGRMGAAKHNDRNFDLDKAKHIDQARSNENIYFCCYKNMSFEEAERRFYASHFGEMISDINERAEMSRHQERKTNPDKLLQSKKTMPEEVIFQIGDKNESATPEQLKAVYKEFSAWHKSKFGDHIKTLNAAMHVDEATPHIQVRRVWIYQHEKGFEAIGQHKALEQMGYQLPDPTQKRGRYNHLKRQYTAECREKWLDICYAHGLEVEREPEHRAPNEQNLKKNDYIIQKQEHILQEQEQVISQHDKRMEIIDSVSAYLADTERDKITAENHTITEKKGLFGKSERSGVFIEGMTKKELRAVIQLAKATEKLEDAVARAEAERQSIIDSGKAEAQKLQDNASVKIKSAEDIVQNRSKIIQKAHDEAEAIKRQSDTLMAENKRLSAEYDRIGAEIERVEPLRREVESLSHRKNMLTEEVEELRHTHDILSGALSDEYNPRRFKDIRTMRESAVFLRDMGQLYALYNDGTVRQVGSNEMGGLDNKSLADERAGRCRFVTPCREKSVSIPESLVRELIDKRDMSQDISAELGKFISQENHVIKHEHSRGRSR